MSEANICGKSMSLPILPTDVLQLIAFNLPLTDLPNWRQVSKKFNSMINEYFWRLMYHRDYSVVPLDWQLMRLPKTVTYTSMYRMLDSKFENTAFIEISNVVIQYGLELVEIDLFRLEPGSDPTALVYNLMHSLIYCYSPAILNLFVTYLHQHISPDEFDDMLTNFNEAPSLYVLDYLIAAGFSTPFILNLHQIVTLITQNKLAEFKALNPDLYLYHEVIVYYDNLDFINHLKTDAVFNRDVLDIDLLEIAYKFCAYRIYTRLVTKYRGLQLSFYDQNAPPDNSIAADDILDLSAPILLAILPNFNLQSFLFDQIQSESSVERLQIVTRLYPAIVDRLTIVDILKLLDIATAVPERGVNPMYNERVSLIHNIMPKSHEWLTSNARRFLAAVFNNYTLPVRSRNSIILEHYRYCYVTQQIPIDLMNLTPYFTNTADDISVFSRLTQTILVDRYRYSVLIQTVNYVNTVKILAPSIVSQKIDMYAGKIEIYVLDMLDLEYVKRRFGVC